MSNYRCYLILWLVAIFCVKLSLQISFYSSNDDVVVLHGDNILTILNNSPNLWMVNFYLDWCAHCEEFSPSYKALARDIADWYWFIKIGAINCGDAAPSGDENSLTCHQAPFLIPDYPQLRIFPANSNTSNGGTDFEITVSLQEIRTQIVRLIEENYESFSWQHGNFKPNLSPVSYEFLVKNVFSLPRMNLESRYKYLALVFEEDSSGMGKEIILDMSTYNNIVVRRVIGVELQSFVKFYNITEDLPFVALVSAKHRPQLLEVLYKTRYFYGYQLKMLPEVRKHHVSNNTETLPWLKPPSSSANLTDGSEVYLADVESGLRYMLLTEIPASKDLSGKKLAALKKMILLLSLTTSHFPHRRPTILFIQDLNKWLAPRTSINSSEWLIKVRQKLPNQHLPSRNRYWVGCMQTEDGTRGYPCSLWIIFHALSVASYRAKLDKQLVPRTMQDYILHFFGCRECRVNFKKEVKSMPFHTTDSDYDAILWLWKIHNKINKRLSETSSAKIQFPPEDVCLHCFEESTGRWSESKVAMFLIDHYSKDYVSWEFLDDNDKGIWHRAWSLFSMFGKRVFHHQSFHPRALKLNDKRNSKFLTSKQTLSDHKLGTFVTGLCMLVLFLFFLQFNRIRRRHKLF